MLEGQLLFQDLECLHILFESAKNVDISHHIHGVLHRDTTGFKIGMIGGRAVADFLKQNQRTSLSVID